MLELLKRLPKVSSGTTIAVMTALRSIRKRLGVSQGQIAEILGCNQSNVSGIERGQYAMSPAVAAKLIEFSRSRGLEISYDHVYGAADLPPEASLALPTPEQTAAGQGA